MTKPAVRVVDYELSGVARMADAGDLAAQLSALLPGSGVGIDFGLVWVHRVAECVWRVFLRGGGMSFMYIANSRYHPREFGVGSTITNAATSFEKVPAEEALAEVERLLLAEDAARRLGA